MTKFQYRANNFVPSFLEIRFFYLLIKILLVKNHYSATPSMSKAKTLMEDGLENISLNNFKAVHRIYIHSKFHLCSSNSLRVKWLWDRHDEIDQILKVKKMEGIHESLQDQNLQSSVEDLPDEVLEFILGFLPPYKDLQNCMVVCKRWYICATSVFHQTSTKLLKAIGDFNILWKNVSATDMGYTITRRFSHAACVFENNMYVFGGCTTNATSFNDLWRFDLSKRQWVRPLATGTYPVPKAYTTMVHYKDSLIVFGGWTYPSLSHYYNQLTMFNEIHFYDVNANKWLLMDAINSPPPMAGHSACMKNEEMIVFGGLTQSPAFNHEIQCSNDVWVLDVPSLTWRNQPTTKPRPAPRYSQSIIRLDSDRLLLLGGVQSLHNRFVYNDCWILNMTGPVWTWKELAVKNKEWASSNIWCNPACRVGDKIVSLSKSRNGLNGARPLVTSAVRLSTLNRPENPPVSVRVEQSLQKPLGRDQNINGKRGELPRRPLNPSRPEQVNPVAGPSNELRNENNGVIISTAGPSSEISRISRKDSPIRGTKKDKNMRLVRQLQEANRYRMAAFACDTTQDSVITDNDLINQRNVAHLENRGEPREPSPPENPPTKQPEVKKNKSTLTMHVLDISTVVNGNSFNYVSWLCPRLGETNGAPEELIMYSLVKGNGELIMFGGVTNGLSCANNYTEINHMYSNSLYTITSPRDII